MESKTTLKFASVTATTAVTAAQTLTWSTASDKYRSAKLGAVNAVIVINVKTLGGGTTPSLTFDVQEHFSDAFIVGAAKTSAISATGVTTISSESQTGSQIVLGKGDDMQIVVTPTGSPTTVAYDIYITFY